MIAAIRAELRKLFTIRSTYFIIAFCLIVLTFFAFFISGYRQQVSISDPRAFSSIMTGTAQFLAFFISFAAVLLVTHEYRYNTIAYTLTAARSRTHVFVAKIIVVTIFSVLLTVLLCVLAPLLMKLGLAVKGLSVGPQTVDVADVLWRVAFYGWFYSMFALVVAFFVRNQVGTFGILFLFPSLGEQLLSLLLKENAKFLPFNALNQLMVGGQGLPGGATALSHVESVQVGLLYVVIGLVVAWLLFARRDAN